MLNSAFRIYLNDAEIVINSRDQNELIDEVKSRFRRGCGFALATLNLDHLVKLRRSPAFRRAYELHDLVVADGNPVVWLSRVCGNPVSLVPGSDLVEPLCQLAAAEDVPVALVGSTSEALARAAAELARAAPGLRIVARLAPSQNFDPEGEEAGELIEALRRSTAGLTLLALGAPRQEIFAARARAALPSMGFASVGAGIDFIAKSQKRAPIWVRRLALEWLWRLLGSPRRLAGRYASCAAILPTLTFMMLTRPRGS